MAREGRGGVASDVVVRAEVAGVRGEKRLGAVGLGLFFLFPLVGLFQLGDADDAWRQVAARARPAVLSVHETTPGDREASTAVACAVVLDTSPLRAVVVGRAPAVTLRSPTASGWISWTPVHGDPHGAFTILAAAPLAPGEPPQTAGLDAALAATPRRMPLAAASMAHAQAAEEDAQPVSAALVAPAPLDELPLWVGVLESDRAAAGRDLYRGTRLRALRGAAGQAAAASAGTPSIHPALQGAPFVTREGAVVALYAGMQGDGFQAVPIGLVRAALDGLAASSPR